jgi:hypothetical protein
MKPPLHQLVETYFPGMEPTEVAAATAATIHDVIESVKQALSEQKIIDRILSCPMTSEKKMYFYGDTLLKDAVGDIIIGAAVALRLAKHLTSERFDGGDGA